MAERTPKEGSAEARGLERHWDPKNPTGARLKVRPDMSLNAVKATNGEAGKKVRKKR